MGYEVIKNIQDISYEEWVEIRKLYIGGSDAGAICGVNPWASPASVWLSKQEDTEPIPDNERMRIGRDLEDYVAERFSEETGLKVRRNNQMMISKEFPFMMANIDREIVGEKSVLECKTTGSYSKDQWEDGNVPDHYYCQVQHYLSVMNYDKGYIAVLIGNESFKWYEIPRDDDYIDFMIRKEKEFYNKNMLGGAFPDPDGTEAYSTALKNLYSNSNSSEIKLDNLSGIVQDYMTIQAQIKALKGEQEQLKQLVQIEMKDNEVASIGENRAIWKEVVSTRFDKKKFEEDYPDLAKNYYYETTSRRFSVK